MREYALLEVGSNHPNSRGQPERALADLNICPKNAAIVGFDNNEIARLSTPTITSADTWRILQRNISVYLPRTGRLTKKEQDYRLVLPVRLRKSLSVGNEFKSNQSDE